MKCGFVSCMIACSLRDGRSVRIECGQFSFTGDVRSTNFKVMVLNYAALHAFAHCHIHVIFTACFVK